MKGKDLTALVEECLQRLDRGDDLPMVLADHPQLSEQLKPILLVAMASRAFPVPAPQQTAQRLGRNLMLDEMNRLEIKKAFRKKSSIPFISRITGHIARLLRQGGYNKLAYSYRLAMVSFVLILSGGFLTLNASASSQPGDFLYRLKQSLSRAGLVWTIDTEDQPQFPGNPDRSPDFQVPVGSEYSARNVEVSNYLLDRFEDEVNVASSSAEEWQSSSAGDNDNQPRADLPDTAAADYAPGTQDQPATVYAPGQQDGPAADFAPGQVKVDEDDDVVMEDDQDQGQDAENDEDTKDKEDKEKDEKDKEKKENEKVEQEKTSKDKKKEKKIKDDNKKDKKK